MRFDGCMYPMTKQRNLWIIFLRVLLTVTLTSGFKPEQTVRRGPGTDQRCMSPLISSRALFPDLAFSASSVLRNRTDFQPYQARFTNVYDSKEHTSGFAWCPNAPVNQMLREWIQAEFPQLIMIKSIFTVGRGDGNFKEFMPNFILKYQREDGGPWFEHTKRDGTKILIANSDPRNLARVMLETTIVAKRIRIYPYSQNGNQDVCLRFALYGCQFPDGVVSYTIPPGGLHTNAPSYRSLIALDQLDPTIVTNLKDLTYDGQFRGATNQLTSGLGQLMDNVAFLGNLTRESDMYPDRPGFHFVGWDLSRQHTVELVFTFDSTRRFTWLRLFTFDSLPLPVRLFTSAVVAFSTDGMHYTDAVEFSTGRVQFHNSRPPHSLTQRSASVSSASSLSSSSSVAAATAAAAKVAASSQRHRPGRAFQPNKQHQEPLTYVYPEYDGAMVVELALNERVGRYLRLSLTKADSWIVLSEVQFNSTVVIATTTEPTVVAPSHANMQTVNKTVEKTMENSHSGGDSSGVDTREIANSIEETNAGSRLSPQSQETEKNSVIVSEQRRDMGTGRNSSLQVYIVAGVCTVLFIFLIIILLIYCSRREHRKQSRLRCGQKINLTSGPNTEHLFTHHHANHQGGLSHLEASKLLLSPKQQQQQQQQQSIPPQQLCLSNGAQSASLIPLLSDLLSDHQQTTNPANAILYPATSRLPPNGTVGMMMQCGLNSSGSNASEQMNTMPVSASNGMPSTGQTVPVTFAPIGSEMYAGADVASMNGLLSLASNHTNTAMSQNPHTGQQHTRYVPALIAINPNQPNSTTFVLQPCMTYAPSNLMFDRPVLGVSTPDSGSLYASIRASLIQSGQATGLSGAESESYARANSFAPPVPPKPVTLTCTSPHNECAVEGSVDVRNGRWPDGEDTDEDVMDMLNEETNESSVEPTKSTKSDSLAQCEQPIHVRVNSDAGEQSLISESMTARGVPVKRRSANPRPQASSNCSSRRLSGHSLPGSEHSNRTRNSNVLVASTDGLVLSWAQQTPSGLLIPHQYHGPEYASASVFAYTPPLSEPNRSMVQQPPPPLPPSCSDSMPASNYRPSLPNNNYNTLSMLPPNMSGYAASLAPSQFPSMPVHTASTLRLPPSRHLGSHPSSGLLVLPQSSLISAGVDDATGQQLYQAIPSAHAQDVARYLSAYSPQDQMMAGQPQQHISPHLNGTMTTNPRGQWPVDTVGDTEESRNMAAWLTGSQTGALIGPGLFHPQQQPGLQIYNGVLPGRPDFIPSTSAHCSPQHHLPLQQHFIPHLQALNLGYSMENQPNELNNCTQPSPGQDLPPGAYNKPVAMDTHRATGASGDRRSIYSVCT